MEKTLYVIAHIPKKAKILLVDMQKTYFNYSDYDTDINIVNQVNYRVERMRDKLLQLRTQHEVYAIIDEPEPIIPQLKHIPHKTLPYWIAKDSEINSTEELDPAHKYILEPTIAKSFNKDDVIVVCGLWKELCVLAVTRLLQKEGFTAYLSIDSDICLENALVWNDEDVTTLENECDSCNIKIQLIEGESEIC